MLQGSLKLSTARHEVSSSKDSDPARRKSCRRVDGRYHCPFEKGKSWSDQWTNLWFLTPKICVLQGNTHLVGSATTLTSWRTAVSNPVIPSPYWDPLIFFLTSSQATKTWSNFALAQTQTNRSVGSLTSQTNPTSPSSSPCMRHKDRFSSKKSGETSPNLRRLAGNWKIWSCWNYDWNPLSSKLQEWIFSYLKGGVHKPRFLEWFALDTYDTFFFFFRIVHLSFLHGDRRCYRSEICSLSDASIWEGFRWLMTEVKEQLHTRWIKMGPTTILINGRKWMGNWGYNANYIVVFFHPAPTCTKHSASTPHMQVIRAITWRPPRGDRRGVNYDGLCLEIIGKTHDDYPPGN